ncbi:hypothetical protein SAMN05660859_0161 [Ancylobacter rudongensis]|uniref:Uncharacterized protein n=2 Tax=Ancylobacter rudongensis TaxID=177413 RepID=A0A1G4UQM9_9HYPH|nr:hypothetical protein SAMN05660859_0161 [Ancylobacter rudongensis]
MPQTQNATVTVGAADIEALDMALMDLDLSDASAGADEAPLEEVVEDDDEVVEQTAEPVVHAGAVLNPDELTDLDIAIERAEVYENQTATVGGDPTATTPAAAKSAKSAKSSKKPSTGAASTPRTPRDLSAVAPEFFALLTDLDPAIDMTAYKAGVISTRPTQVKVAEKFDNLFQALSVGKAPSSYVMIAFKLLDEKKTVSSSDIIGAYKASGLGEGTARSQCGQIMNLFATVAIASRVGQVLTLNDKSALAQRIRDLK